MKISLYPACTQNKTNLTTPAFSQSFVNKLKNEFNTEKNEGQNSSTKKSFIKWGGLSTLLITGISVVKKLFSRPSNLLRTVDDLIKVVKPEDIEAAKGLFPVLMKNMDNLQIKPENFKQLLDSIRKENMQFMIEEGTDLISSKMENLKNYITNQLVDLSLLFESLSKNNKNLFSFVTENLENLKIRDFEDIQTFLKLNPEKQDYIQKSLLPELLEHRNAIGLKTPDRYATLLKNFTPEFDDIIKKVAASDIDKKTNINKYSILTLVTNENKDCVMPLLNNAEKLKYSTSELKKILQSLTNNDASGIQVVANNIEQIKQLGIKPENLFGIIKSPDAAGVFEFVINKSQLLKIQELSDIKIYLKTLKTENLEYITEELTQCLEKNMETLGIQSADQIADILKNADPTTLNTIRSVAKYAETLGNNISYPALLGAVNKTNAAKLDKLMKTIHQTDVWDNSMVSPDDFAVLLAKI